MKALAITNKGLESISALEIYELIGKKAKIGETVVSFEADENEICRLCYMGRSFVKVIELLKEFDFKTKEDIIKNSNIKIDAKTFVVRCQREGSHDFTSQEISEEVGEAIFNSNKIKVELEDPEKTVYVYVYGDKCYIGIDYAGIDLSKREYKIFSHPASVRGNIAYSLLRIADYSRKNVLLDPFCKSGEICIEAALSSCGLSQNFYSKNKFAFLKFAEFDFEKEDKKAKLDEKVEISCFDTIGANLKAAEKNAKIAGVNKKIRFSRIDTDWLDVKVKEKSVDCIVTILPDFKEEKIAEKNYKEFFYQAKYVLKKNGVAVLLCKKPEIVKKASDLKLAEEFEVMSGKQKLAVLKYKA